MVDFKKLLANEILAKDLHEAGRAAVLANKVHKKDGAPVGQIIFKEWHEIDADAKEGRRIQAEWLLEQYHMERKSPHPDHKAAGGYG